MSTIPAIDRPVFVGCAGRCGGMVPILWPSPLDVRLQQLGQELALAGYVVAQVEASGETCTAILCTRCAAGALVRTKIRPPDPRTPLDGGKKRK